MAQDEKKVAGAQYIYTFYNEVESLVAQEAAYINLLLEFKEKYWQGGRGEGDLNKVPEEEKKVLVATVQQVRYFCLKVHKKYEAIKDILRLDKSKEINESYNAIKDTFIIKREDLEKFTAALNKVLVQDIIGSLMETSQEFLKDVLQDGTQTA